MKKISIFVLAALLTLGACSNIKTTKITTRYFGNFELPETMSKEEIEDSDGMVSYSDASLNDGMYFAQLNIANYYFEDMTYNEFIEEAEEAYIPSLNEYIFDDYDVDYAGPVSSTLEIDGRNATRYTTRGADKFTVEYIVVEDVIDESTTYFIEITLIYSEDKYPNLSDLFLKSYTIPRD